MPELQKAVTEVKKPCIFVIQKSNESSSDGKKKGKQGWVDWLLGTKAEESSASEEETDNEQSIKKDDEVQVNAEEQIPKAKGPKKKKRGKKKKETNSDETDDESIKTDDELEADEEGQTRKPRRTKKKKRGKKKLQNNETKSEETDDESIKTDDELEADAEGQVRKPKRTKKKKRGKKKKETNSDETDDESIKTDDELEADAEERIPKATGAKKKKKGNKKSRNNKESESASSSEEEETDKPITDPLTLAPDQNSIFGTVDVIAEELKDFLVKTYQKGLGYLRMNDRQKLPDDSDSITIYMRLEYNKELDCPCLKSSWKLWHSYSFVMYAQTGNVEDIMKVLRQPEIASFKLEFVHEKYLATVEDFLSSNKYLHRLHLGEHFLKKDQEMVRNVIQSSKSLSILAFETEFNQKHHQSIKEYLLHAIHECKPLTKIDLAHVRSLTSTIIDGLVEGFKKNNNSSAKIKILDMSIADRSKESTDRIDISKLAKVLMDNNKSLEEWSVGGRIIKNSESIKQCAKLLEDNKTLKKLDLASSSCFVDPPLVDPLFWVFIAKVLTPARSTSLQYLDISGHQLSVKSWEAFGECLKTNNSLLTLKAKEPAYGKHTDILLPVFEALRENKTLESLLFSSFDLCDSLESLKVLESALMENKSLKSVELRNSGISYEGTEILKRSRSKMKGLKELVLSQDKIAAGIGAYVEKKYL